MQNILALQFNNYFNRKIKRYTSIKDYISNSSNSDYSRDQFGQVKSTSFNPNDSVRTDFVLNWDKEWNPDYILVIEDNVIQSRWFILEATRLCKNQFSLRLKRDTVADKYDIVVNSPCFIEKGFVNESNPLIFNREDFDCNQIKIDEEVVCDKSYCAWLVVYYNLSKKSELSGDVSIATEPAIEIGTTLESWPLYENFHTNGSYKVNNTKKYSVEWKNHLMSTDFVWHWFETKITFNERSTPINQEGREVSYEPNLSLEGKGFVNESSQLVIDYLDDQSDVRYYLDQYGEPSTSFDDFFKWNGVLIKTSDNKYYRIRIENEGNQEATTLLTSGSLYNTLASHFMSGGVLKSDWLGDLTKTFKVTINSTNYKIYADLETQSVESFHYDFTNIHSLTDGSYGIIAFPFDNKNRTKNVWQINYRLKLDLGILIAKDMCSAGVGTDKRVFDVQLLPYCPIELPSTINANGGTVLDTTYVDSSLYTLIKDSGNSTRMIAIHPLSCKRTEFINFKTWMIYQFYFASGKYAYKIENQCTFYRLVSPNYNGQFEFNRAKNRDFNTFRLDITYKPYQPYIHLAPIFGGIYGKDFGDARGLICGGDFTFGVTSSKFEEYKMQNKNYQDIFNRQIENMDKTYEINQKYGLIRTIEGEVASVGAMAGGLALGHKAAAVGGLLGTVGTATAGITNYFQQKEQYGESRKYAIDMHNYQLGNVKALPDSLAKVDAYTSNNKLFPILEKYSCTNEEVEIFKNKIKYEGMTVNAIGKIVDYVDQLEEFTFVKGKFYRLDDLNEENHFANDIAEEFAKGLYIKS